MAAPLRRPQNLMGYGKAQVFQPSGESPFFDEYSRQKQLGQRDRSLDIQEGNVAQQQKANAAKIRQQNENIKYDYLKGLSRIKGNVSPYIRSKLSESRDDILESVSELDPSELKRSILKLNDQINIYNALDDEMIKRATSVAEGKLYPSWMSNGVLNNNPDVNEDAFDNLVADMDIDQALGTLSGVISGGFAPNVNPAKRYTEFFNDELSSVILNDPQIPAKTRREQIAGTNKIYEQDYKTLSPEQAFGYFDGFLGADKDSQSFIGMLVLNNLHDRGINIPTKEQVDEETQNVLNSMDIPTTVYGKERSGTVPQDNDNGKDNSIYEGWDLHSGSDIPRGDMTRVPQTIKYTNLSDNHLVLSPKIKEGEQPKKRNWSTKDGAVEGYFDGYAKDKNTGNIYVLVAKPMTSSEQSVDLLKQATKKINGYSDMSEEEKTAARNEALVNGDIKLKTSEIITVPLNKNISKTPLNKKEVYKRFKDDKGIESVEDAIELGYSSAKKKGKEELIDINTMFMLYSGDKKDGETFGEWMFRTGNEFVEDEVYETTPTNNQTPNSLPSGAKEISIDDI